MPQDKAHYLQLLKKDRRACLKALEADFRSMPVSLAATLQDLKTRNLTTRSLYEETQVATGCEKLIHALFEDTPKTPPSSPETPAGGNSSTTHGTGNIVIQGVDGSNIQINQNTGNQSELSEWVKALEENSLVGYLNFLRSFPHGEKADEAHARCLKLQAALTQAKITVPKTPSPQSQPETRSLDLGKGITMDFIFVKGGKFMMGDELEEWDFAPQHEVQLSDFYMAKYPVTQEQWEAVMGNNPSKFEGAKHPVEGVSYADAYNFIMQVARQIGMRLRLPTEAQWEYAARGGQKSQSFLYAGSNHIDEVAWYKENSMNTTHPVGKRFPNELGLFDLSGGVWEWCSDWFDLSYYRNSPKENPNGPHDGRNRVLRGASWDTKAKDCRIARRTGLAPNTRRSGLGFRCAISL